jgi:hypothetical protein
MMTPVHRAVLVSALFGLSLATARDALADPTKAQCVEADTAAQSDRRGEHLRAAREHLELCSKPACPALVREDCFQRLSDLESMAPTIVFAAKDAAGEDVAAVRVSMDGAPFATELAGAALPVDPGLHTFTFDTDGASTVEKKVVVREGEKGRQERIIFSTLHAPAVLVVAPLPPPSVDHATTSSWTSQKTAAVVAGAVGLAGVIAGSITGAMAFSRWSSSQSECGDAGCTDRAKALSDHDSASTFATVSDAAFIAGGVLVAGGVVLYLTAPRARSSSSTSGMLRLVPAVGVGGGGMRLEGRF